jgi:hypothetical protein
MPEARVLVNFETTPAMRQWFKDAAHAERMTMSAWLRRVATARAVEVAPQPGADRPAAAKRA